MSQELETVEGLEQEDAPEPALDEGVEESEPEAEQQLSPEEELAKLREQLADSQVSQKGLLEELRETRRAHKTELTRLESRIVDLNDFLTKPKPVSIEEQLGPEPDKSEDPAAWIDWRDQKRNLELREERAEQEAKQRQDLQQKEWERQRPVIVSQAERQFLSADGAPSEQEYVQAVNRLRDFRVRQLMAGGFDEVAARQYEQQEELSLIDAAIQRGDNPAALAWEMYQQFSPAPQATRPNGAKPSRAQNEVAAVAAGVRESGVSGGGSPKRVITLERLAKMDDDEYQNFRATLTERQWETLNLTGRVNI